MLAWSNATGCPVMEQTFDVVDAVGAFLDSGLTYTPQLNSNVNITAYFNISSDLVSGDKVTFTLPGFNGPTAPNLILKGSLVSQFQGSWNSTTKKLVFSVIGAVPAYTHVNLTVINVNQLQLPVTGLRPNASELRVAFTTQHAYVDDAAVMYSPGIGKSSLIESTVPFQKCLFDLISLWL